MKSVLELRRTNKENIKHDENVAFDVVTQISEGINYEPTSGKITFIEAGQYSVRWWIATETNLEGCMQFALVSSQGDLLESCSPTKRGQLTGFGAIDAKSAFVDLALLNIGSGPVVLSQTAPITAALLVMRIPDDTTIPSFSVSETRTLNPGEPATADVQEDLDHPNNWLFTFGIPAGETGPAGELDYHNFSVTSENTVANPVNFTVGNIRFAFSYYNSTTYQLRLYPAEAGTNVLYDYRRVGFYGGSYQVETRDNDTLTDAGWLADDTIYSQSNEWQSTFLRQRNPDGTWSLCEYKLFGSANLSRITLWITWIYKNQSIAD